MRIWHELSDVAVPASGSAVTIGKFDGVHIGHLAIITQLCSLATERGLQSVVVTFDKHPSALFRPETAPQDITGLDHRLELLEASGVDAALVLPFTAELAALSPADFAAQVLQHALNAKLVFVGQDFRFGSHAAGDVAALRELGALLGFDVVLIGDVCHDDGQRASSSWIRELLEHGEVAQAAELLGRLPSVQGEVVHGAARGRELGFPTANLSQDSTGLAPADGVYAGWLTARDVRYPAAISVGTNPTFAGQLHRTVEAYVIDEDLDLYGEHVIVEFAAHLRPMLTFDGIDALIEQMRLDVDQARAITSQENAR